MGDNFRGTIYFPAHMIDDEIKQQLECEGVEFDQDGNLKQVEDFVWIQDGLFVLSDWQASWGQFEDLENLLKLKGIPFDRDSEGYYEYNPEEVIFRPGSNGSPPLEKCFNTQDNEPVIPLEKIKALIPQGLDAIKNYIEANFPDYPSLATYVKEHDHE